jgi:ATP-dependent RNA helicase DDX1
MSGGFPDLGLLPELVKATQDLNWVLPSDVQDESIPLILGGGDVMVAAETGSGKTGAFALPAIQIVHEVKRDLEESAAAAAAAKAGGASSAAASASSAAPAAAATLNVNDRSALVTLSPDRLMSQCRHPKDWGGVRAGRGVMRGRVCYEVTVRDDGLCRVGWSTAAASLDLGTDRGGFGYGGTGKRSHDRAFEAYGEEFKKGDVIGCLLDARSDACVIGWTKNGKFLGNAFTLAKAPGVLFPAASMKNAELEINFGASPFAFAPPEGYVSLDAAAPEGLVTAATVSGGAAAAADAAGPKGRPRVAPFCIILAPARDLAEQTAKQIEALARYVAAPAVSQALVIGGMNAKFVRDQLHSGADVIVATPGMLMKEIDSKEVSLDRVRLLVLDEADRFAGEKENLATILKLHGLIRTAIDRGAEPGRLQVCFFSATLHSPEITSLGDAICSRPTWVDLKGKDSVPESVHHVIVDVNAAADRSWTENAGYPAVPVDGVHAKDNVAKQAAKTAASLSTTEASEGAKLLKPRMLVSLIDSLAMTQAIIFCRTNVDCDNLENFLIAVGGGQKWKPGQEKGKENKYSW